MKQFYRVQTVTEISSLGSDIISVLGPIMDKLISSRISSSGIRRIYSPTSGKISCH